MASRFSFWVSLPCPNRPASLKLIVRLIFLVGPQPTLNFLGSSAVLLKDVHVITGTFQRSVRQICTDTEIVYHVVYLTFCFLGLVTHPAFFSVLVR